VVLADVEDPENEDDLVPWITKNDVSSTKIRKPKEFAHRGFHVWCKTHAYDAFISKERSSKVDADDGDGDDDDDGDDEIYGLS